MASREENPDCSKFSISMTKDGNVELQTYTVFVGSYNVFLKRLDKPLTEWLAIDNDAPDIYAIGFQELDLINMNKENDWLKTVTASLNTTVKYKIVKHIPLCGISMIVFIKESLSEHIKNVAADYVVLDKNEVYGNKGGMAIRLDFHHTSICFINCHLYPHMEQMERRNRDYHDISARIAFNEFNPIKHIKDHDKIFWFGDMNYRIADLDRELVKSLANEKSYSKLLEHDQLILQKNLGEIFVGFYEGQISFAPTYKYDTGTNNWDSSEKCRVPSWCDRVLWKGDNIRQITYRSHPTLVISDHKPIRAIFEVEVIVAPK